MTTPRPLKICLVYDHLFPLTVGGGERWMRDLALGLAAAGHDVTYLTMRHWEQGHEPRLAGVTVIGVTRKWRVYGDRRRALMPPLLFGIAVFRHLLRQGARYDVVHTASFPYFPLLAVGFLRRRFGYQVVVDWWEVWSKAYWQSYAGALVGSAGWVVQRLAIRVRSRAFCLSQMHADRLRAEGFGGSIAVLPGLYSGPVQATPEGAVEPIVVFAGRHVREKRVPLLVHGFALTREERPDLRLDIYGDGPERRGLERLVARLGLGSHVRVLGARPEAEVAAAFAHAICVATGSEREGYGLVVVEAAARGTPSVVVDGPENAAVELVREGVNGAVAPRAEPEEVAGAILRVVAGGPELRASTVRWFSENVTRLRIENSLAEVMASYAGPER